MIPPPSHRPPGPRGRGHRPWAGPGRVLASLAFAAALAGCSLLYDTPEVRIADVRVTGVGLSGATARIGLEVENPNGFSLTSTGLTYRLTFADPDASAGDEAAWRTIAEGGVEETLTVPGEGTRRVDIEVPFRYEDVGRAFRAFLQEGEIRYRLTGDVAFDAPLGGLRVPFTETGDVGL